MSLVTLNLPSLHNGVSQQPPQVRSTDQCEAQENAWVSLADGLLKRPSTEVVAKISDVPLDNAFVHDINRDTVERYTVIATAGVLRVFDADGTEIPVSAPGGWSYLDGVTDFAADLSMTTVADYTFIVNRTLSPAMRTPPPVDPEAPPGTEPVYPPIPGEDTFFPPRQPGGNNPLYLEP